MSEGVLVTMRHGQSQLNKEDRFAGWFDTPLTDAGREEARAAGRLLLGEHFIPDLVFVSPLVRTRDSAVELLATMNLNINPHYDERILERFYGGLTGLNRAETRAKYGEDKFHQFRRSYDIPPPAMTAEHPNHPENKGSEQKIRTPDFGLPASGYESLKDVEARVLPFWNEVLLPAMQQGKKVLIVAHGNSLRALVKIMKRMTPAEVEKFEVERAKPALFAIESAAGSKDWRINDERFIEGKEAA